MLYGLLFTEVCNTPSGQMADVGQQKLQMPFIRDKHGKNGQQKKYIYLHIHLHVTELDKQYDYILVSGFCSNLGGSFPFLQISIIFEELKKIFVTRIKLV